MTKKLETTHRQLRKAESLASNLGDKHDRQAIRVAHAWSKVRKLQIKYHKAKQSKIGQQIMKLQRSRLVEPLGSGKVRPMTSKQQNRLGQLQAKLKVEQRTIDNIRHEEGKYPGKFGVEQFTHH